MHTSEEIGIANEAIVFSDCFKCRVKLQTCERQLAGALLSAKCCHFVRKSSSKSRARLACLRRRREKKAGEEPGNESTFT